MKSSITKLLIFTVGAAIGSAVTWKVAQERYKTIADEEIASVKEMYKNKLEENNKKIEEIETVSSRVANLITNPQPKEHVMTEKPDIMEYAKILKKQNYANATTEKEGGDSMNSRIYIIPPEEFGQKDGYDAISLNYFADGVLTDDWNEPIEDVEGTVGKESLTHFGEYEDDSVFVRNDVLKADYEILKDLKNFSDLMDDDDEDE